MILQFRNKKVSNHGSIPITIDCNVVAFIVFEEGFHQPIKDTKQSVFLDVTVFDIHLWISFTPNAAVLFVDVAIQPEVRFIAKQNSLMKIDHYFRNKIAQFESVVQTSNNWEKLEEGRSVTSVAAEFGIAHSIVSRLWRQFQTTGTTNRGFSSCHPRGTTPADDRYIVLQDRRNRRQTAGEIARHTTQVTG
ncbi:hypothetical protein TNCV_3169351 [Trichonephila clavipes]|nr:hypothetical protein TNCV_3169351 [Trichonephila clavipes]